MKQFWDLPWWQRFVFGVGQRSERWRFGNWRIAVVVYTLIGFLCIGASLSFWPAAPAAVLFLLLAWASWHYGRHMKGEVVR
jgi:hypothetical protein